MSHTELGEVENIRFAHSDDGPLIILTDEHDCTVEALTPLAVLEKMRERLSVCITERRRELEQEREPDDYPALTAEQRNPGLADMVSQF